MLIKKGDRVYSNKFFAGTALTNETKYDGAVVKFDMENEMLLSAWEISSMFPVDFDSICIYFGF